MHTIIFLTVLLYSLSIILLFDENSSRKALESLGLLFILYGSPPLLKQQDTLYEFPRSLRGIYYLYNARKMKNLLGKPDFKSVASWHTHFSTGKRNLLSSQSLPVCKWNTGCFYNLMPIMVCSRGCRKKSKQTYIYIHVKQTHTLFSENNFKKQGALKAGYSRRGYTCLV